MFVGSDTDQLRSTADQLDGGARSGLSATLKNVEQSAQTLDWVGLDADEFRKEVSMAVLLAELTLGSSIGELAALLRRRAALQDATSDTLSISDLLHPGLPGNWSIPGGRAEPMPWNLVNPPAGNAGTLEGQISYFGGSPYFDESADGRTVELDVLSGEMSGSARFVHEPGKVGASAQGHVGAYLINAAAAGSASLGAASIAGSARAFAGAEADGHASVELSKDGLKAEAGGSAFAGAKATAEANLDIAGVGAGAKAEAWAGIGVQGEAAVSVTADAVEAHISIGAAIGVGASCELEVKIEPKKIIEEVSSWLPW